MTYDGMTDMTRISWFARAHTNLTCYATCKILRAHGINPEIASYLSCVIGREERSFGLDGY